jgi:hypothetical protein
MRIAQRQTLTLGSYRRLGSGAPIPNGSITVAARGSVFFDGAKATDWYSAADSASFDFPDDNWFLASLIYYRRTTGTQYIASIGTQGGTHNVQLYTNNNVVTAQVRSTGSSTFIPTGATLTAGWWVVGVQRNGTDVEIFTCPLSGSASFGTKVALTITGVITPSGTHTFGARSSVATSTYFWNNISWVARGTGTLSGAEIASLAAGQDILTNLGKTLAWYHRYDTASATITDSSGNGNTLTRQGTPRSRGGPRWSGVPFAVDTLNGKLDATYGYVFQRASGGTSRSITFIGTYNGSPAGIEARVINADGTANTAWKRCNTPSAGVWNVTLSVAQGGELALEVRDTVTTTNCQRTLFPWGVGAVLLFTGESIADQQASGSSWSDTGSTDYPSSIFTPDRQQSSIVYLRDAWQNSTSYTANTSLVCDGTNFTLWRCATSHTSPATGTFAADRAANPSRWTAVDISAMQVDTINNSAGAAMHTVDRVRRYAGVPCMAVFGAKTGSQLVGGAPNNWATYTDTVTHGKLKAAIANTESDYEAIYWLQGANDANAGSPPSAAAYQSALEAVIPQIRSYVTGRTAATLPVIIAKVGTNTAGGSAVDAGWRQVRNGQSQSIPNITNALDLEMYDLAHADALHPSTAGYIRLGKRQAQAYLNYLLPGTYTNPTTGASVASAVRDSGGTFIDVVFTLNFGTTLQGLTGSTGLTGFRVLRSGVAQSITGAVVQSANTIRLSGSFNAGDIVDYIDIQNPAITNNVFTNASVIGDAAGVPVKPFIAGITV